MNPDIAAVYQQSAGSTTDNSGLQTPLYTNTNVTIQVQACTGKDLRHAEFLNLQGVLRTVFMYGNTQGVNRVDVKGGDLLQFQNHGRSQSDVACGSRARILESRRSELV